MRKSRNDVNCNRQAINTKTASRRSQNNNEATFKMVYEIEASSSSSASSSSWTSFQYTPTAQTVWESSIFLGQATRERLQKRWRKTTRKPQKNCVVEFKTCPGRASLKASLSLSPSSRSSTRVTSRSSQVGIVFFAGNNFRWPLGPKTKHRYRIAVTHSQS